MVAEYGSVNLSYIVQVMNYKCLVGEIKGIDHIMRRHCVFVRTQRRGSIEFVLF